MLSWLRRLWPRRGAAREARCPEVRREASALLEGGLPPEREGALRRHLARCAPCRAFLEGLKSTVDLLRGMPPRAAPPSLRDAIRARLRGAQDPRAPDSGRSS